MKNILFQNLLFFLLVTLGFSACSTNYFSKPDVLDSFQLSDNKAKAHVAVALTDASSDELYGRLSPDGRSLIYSSNQKGNLDIWIKDLSSGLPRRITSHMAKDQMPVFSPDGKRIAFVSMRDDVKGDIYLIDSDGENLTKLTNRSTGDSYPVFSPDSNSIYYVIGNDDDSYIAKLSLTSGKSTQISMHGATQPSISSNGELIAYVKKDKHGINNIWIQNLKSGKKIILATSGFHCGFPTFSTDGQSLFFSRFFDTEENTHLSGNENASIFKFPLNSSFTKGTKQHFQQISSGKHTHLFLQAHNAGILYTTKLDKNLDVMLLSPNGEVPVFNSAEQQLKYALQLENKYDQLLALSYLSNFPGSEEYQQALYLSSRIYLDLDLYQKQKKQLKSLIKIPNALGNWQGLAMVDMAVWDVEYTNKNTAKTGIKVSQAQLEIVFNKLSSITNNSSLSKHVVAYAYLKKGDSFSLSGKDFEGIANYEKVIKDYQDQTSLVIQAKIKLGEIYSQLRTLDLQVAHYISLFDNYPNEEHWLRIAINHIIDEYRQFITSQLSVDNFIDTDNSKFSNDQKNLLLIDHLRNLIDRHPESKLLGAVVQYKMGTLYKDLGKLDLAIHAMKNVINSYPSQKMEVTNASFALGEYTLEYSEELRHDGRYNEAGYYYGEAIRYYENIMKMYLKTTKIYKRAKNNFISLGLLKASQEEFEKDYTASKASYSTIVKLAPDVIQAHRKLIEFAFKYGQSEEIKKEYENKVKNDPHNYIWQYCLGYIGLWKNNLTEKDLDKAEARLQISKNLNSQNPFVYLSLGWINEMRELYLGRYGEGLIEDAIAAYDTAYNLNDRNINIQFEADCLLNLGNSFSHIGNTWGQAYSFYHQRLAINLQFTNKTRKTVFLLNLGRAAFNLDKNDEAAKHFEEALLLAESLNLTQLQAELIARLALNYQSQKAYGTSTQNFEKSIELYNSVDKQISTIPLMRSIAFNHYHAGNKQEAIGMLDKSLDALMSYGAIDRNDFSRITTSPNMSLSPFGFNKDREHEAHMALYNLILNDMQQLKNSSKYLEQQAFSLDNWLAQYNEDLDIMRAVSTVENRKAILSNNLGKKQTALESFNKAYLHYEKIQSTDLDAESDIIKSSPLEKRHHHLSELDKNLMVSLTQYDFVRQMKNLNSASELLFKSTSFDSVTYVQDLNLLLSRLENCLTRYKAIQSTNEEPFIDKKTIWKLKNNLSLLALRQFENNINLKSKADNSKNNPVERLANETRYLRLSVQNLKEVIRETAIPDIEERTEDTIYQYSELRTHLSALLNLAQIFINYKVDSLPSEQGNQENKAHMLLNRAKKICSSYTIDDLCLVADVELAQLTGNKNLMDATINTYLDTPTQILGTRYLESADVFRNKIFNPAIKEALKDKNWTKAFLLIEQKKQKMVTDEFAKLKLNADSPDIKKKLKNISLAQEQLENAVFNQTITGLTDDSIKNNSIIEKQKVKLKKAIEDLHFLSERIYNIIKPKSFKIADLQQILSKNHAIVSLNIQNHISYVFLYNGKTVDGYKLKIPENVLKGSFRSNSDSQTDNDFKATNTLVSYIRDSLGDKLKQFETIYYDTNQISENFPTNLLQPNATAIKYSSVSGLIKSYSNKNLYRKKGLITLDKTFADFPTFKSQMTELAFNNNFDLASYPNTFIKQVLPYFSNSSIMIFNQPLDFEGDSSANIWLKFNEETKGFGHYAFYQHMDSLWKSSLAVFTNVQHTSNVTDENIVMEHTLAHFGLPGYIVLNGKNLNSELLGQILSNLLNKLTDSSRAEALANTTKTLDSKSLSGIHLYGYGGMNKEQITSFAKSQLMPTIKVGIALQKAKSHRAAIEAYEYALTLMEYVKDYKFLDKLLEMLVSESKQIGDFERAILYQHRILDRLETKLKTDPLKIGSILTAKSKLATYYAEIKLYDIALNYNQQIIDTLLNANRQNLTGKYYSQRGIINERAGMFPEALKNYETAYNIFASTQNKSKQIKESINCARILRQRLSNYRRAKYFINKALSLVKSTDDYNKLLLQLGLIRVDLALGNYQRSIDLGRSTISVASRKSQDALDKAMVIFKDKNIPKSKKPELLLPLKKIKSRMDSIVLSTYVELVNSLFRLGDYSEALKIQQKAMSIAKKNKSIRKQIQLNNAKGLIYSFLGNTKMAIETFNWTLSKTIKIDDMGEQASAYNNLGDAYRKSGDFLTAKKMFQKALEIDEKQENRLGIAYDYANLGLVFENMHNYKSAKTYLNEALEISRSIKNPINEVKSLLALGRIAVIQKQFPKAKHFFTLGNGICKSLNLTDWQWKFNLQLGKLFVLLSEREKALDFFILGINQIESLPASIRISRQGPKLEEDKKELYDEALSLLATMKRAEEAFNLSERARSRHFLDILGGKTLEFANDKIATILAKEGNLRKIVSSTYDNYLKSKGKAKVKAKVKAKEDYSAAVAEYDSAIQKLAQIDSRLPSFVTVDALSYNQLQEFIPDNTAITSYFITNNQLIIWTITNSQLNMTTQAISRQNLVSMTNNYRDLLTQFHPVKNVSEELYNILLKPTENIWSDKQKLIIIPNNALHFIPFSALYDGKKHMVEKRPITILNSVNELRFMDNSSKVNRENYRLAMGGPSIETDSPNMPIPFSMQELLSFGYTNPEAKVLMNEQATELFFKQHAVNAKYIHFATHGFFDNVNPYDSHLVLSKDAIKKEDGLLKLHEIISLGLNADLVTLSACNTATGVIGEGDEIIGLSSAFLTAGAKQVIASLWRVSDLSTAILMKHFFRLRLKYSTGQALQKAQLKVKSIFPHPAYWAGFRLEGMLN